MGGVGINLLYSSCSLLVACGVKIGYPLKFNIDTPKTALLERRYIFQGPSFWISIRQISGDVALATLES